MALTSSVRCNSAFSGRTASPTAVVRPSTVARTRMVCNSWSELIAAAGDVEAPIGVPIVAAIVVTAAVTFAVPAYLNRGQQAADQIFSAREKNPLDNKKAAAKKTSAGGKTKRR